jgi:hypothetical protein
MIISRLAKKVNESKPDLIRKPKTNDHLPKTTKIHFFRHEEPKAFLN